MTMPFKLLRGKGKLSESNIEAGHWGGENRPVLEADVNFKVVKSFVSQVREKSLGQKVIRGVDPHQQFIKIVQERARCGDGGGSRNRPRPRKGGPLRDTGIGGGGGSGDLAIAPIKGPAKKFHMGPLPILVVGLNGAGKTTLTGKLARLA